MAKVRALIVENEFIVSLALRYRLEAMGYCVHDKIKFGEEAVEAASRLRPHVVLLDIGLSGSMDGVAAAAEIRRRFNIPVVFLTAYNDEATFARARTTQPSGVIIKPFQDAQLQAAITAAIQ